MLFWKDKKNCWEYMECERGPGGAKADTLGLCPVALNQSITRASGGKNTNHIRWDAETNVTDATGAEGTAKRPLECLQCDYFQQIMHEAETSLKLRGAGGNHDSVIIRTRMTILALLNQSKEIKVRFRVHTDDTSDFFDSTLEDIDPETNVLTFNAQGMTAGWLCKHKNLRISGHMHGSELRFSTTLFGAGEEDGVAFFMAKLPYFVFHPQLRHAYRVELNEGQQSFQAQHASSNHKLEGFVIDLSIDGIGVMLQHQEPLTRGDILEHCLFTLPNGGGVPASIEVRNISYIPQHDTTRIGGRFCGISKSHEQRLGQFINNANLMHRYH